MPQAQAHEPVRERDLPWYNRATSRLVNPRGLDAPAALRAAIGGRVVLITGASYGLGEATARLFAGAGAIVLLVARTRERLDALADEIRAQNGTAHVYPLDLADSQATAALAATVLAEHGAIDVLVHNAGKSIRRSVALSYERFRDYERTNAINYLGPVRLTLGLLPSMRRRGRGQIINVSTMGARLTPAPRWAAYQASKSAFDTWLRSVATEAQTDRVRVTTIYMSLIYTRMSAPTPALRSLPGMAPEQAARLLARAVVERPRSISPPWVLPAEIGGALLRGPLEWAMSRAYRLSDDTEAARGQRDPSD